MAGSLLKWLYICHKAWVLPSYEQRPIMQQGRWQHAGTALVYMEAAQLFANNAAGLILNQLAGV